MLASCRTCHACPSSMQDLVCPSIYMSVCLSVPLTTVSAHDKEPVEQYFDEIRVKRVLGMRQVCADSGLQLQLGTSQDASTLHKTHADTHAVHLIVPPHFLQCVLIRCVQSYVHPCTLFRLLVAPWVAGGRFVILMLRSSCFEHCHAIARTAAA